MPTYISAHKYFQKMKNLQNKKYYKMQSQRGSADDSLHEFPGLCIYQYMFTTYFK